MILRPLRTVDDCLKALGEPDFDSSSVLNDVGEGDRAPSVQWSRVLHYHQLSDVAEVWVQEQPDGRILCSLHGKPLANRGE